jgi:3-isopropylmalate/(R)-2-methylmalate dehydratase large subunit
VIHSTKKGVRVAGKTVSEKILSSKSGQDARAGDLVVCEIDCMIGTNGSTPMAIDLFERMGGEVVAHRERILFALDHYSPPATSATAAFHDRVRAFARRHGISIREVGEGISHQLVTELGRALPGQLVIGADSHTVTGGALNSFATGVGSSDLAAAMICGHVWLKVPESIKVVLTGSLPPGVDAKDIALTLLAELGPGGAAYRTLEFHGPAVNELELEDRMVLSNMSVEAGAKAGIFPADEKTFEYLKGRTAGAFTPVEPETDARYGEEVIVDVSLLSPKIALPHDPHNVVPVEEVVGVPVQMAFLGTCIGGRVGDFHQALRILEAGGGVAPGVQLVATPASKEIYLELIRDGTIAKLADMGAVVTTPGCGACCGTSGPIPGDGMNVISTANRNFKARMGNVTASIFLASPASCAAAAVVGSIADPREVER